MKRLIPLLFIFLAACTTSANMCTDDGTCSSSELLRGGCDDCKPDFTVSNLEANYQGDELYVYYCVENINGQYEGPLSVSVGMSGQETIYAERDQEINFRSSVIDANAWVFPTENGIDYSFNIREGDRDEMWCSSERFETPNAESFHAWVAVDRQQEVEEIDEENNYDQVSVETGFIESYPEYLIEEDVGEYDYQSSRRFSYENSGEPHEAFTARYVGSFHTYVQVRTEERTPHDGQEPLSANVTIGDVTMPVDLHVESQESNRGLYYHYVNWNSDGMNLFTVVHNSESDPASVLSDDLVRAYLLMYPTHPEFRYDVVDTLREEETQTYAIGGVDYEVTAVFIGESDSERLEAKFAVNGEITDSLQSGDVDTLNYGLQIGVRDLLVNSREGVVEFFLDASEVRDFVDITLSQTLTGSSPANVTFFGKIIASGPVEGCAASVSDFEEFCKPSVDAWTSLPAGNWEAVGNTLEATFAEGSVYHSNEITTGVRLVENPDVFDTVTTKLS